MPSGYLVTLGDGSLDANDVISGGYVSFTTDEVLGTGQWVWSGRWGGRNYTNEVEPGSYVLATNGNVYFVPDYGSVDRLNTASVVSAPAYSEDAPDGLIEGTGGADLIDASYVDPNGDQVDGGTGTGAGGLNDSIVAYGGNDTVYSGQGGDTVDGGAGNDSIDGGDGADSLVGGSGSDTLIGGTGDDTLAGGAGGDSLSGGSGMDYLDYSTSSAGVAIDLGANTASGGDATGDTLAGGLDGIIGSDWNDTLTGYDGQGADWTNVFYGGAGDDLIDGAGGDDSLFGEDGNDTIWGGAGADVVDGGAGDDVLHVGSGDTATGGAGNDTFVLDTGNLGGGTITIDGSETAEPGGDTLDFGGLIDWDDVSYSNTDPAALAGSATLADGTLVNFQNIESVIICFTAGTRILTPFGPRPVETLRLGDQVVTRDNGVQPIRWVGKRQVEGHGTFAPIRFAPRSIGNTHELLVSPQHRMLHRSSMASLYFDSSEVLIPAKYMVNGTTIRQHEQASVEYIHILFDQHEIVFAEGAASESFHPAQMGLEAISDPAREELFELFPELRGNPNGYGDTARQCLRSFEARILQAA
ncbi:Hint domain-containing protein [Thalassovita taeanensis]|uniref:Hemolysin-type calcium-binding repeat-containing protein n=1 Tax=Thalassovita taeanensis TaxID=657014 RepID=A0A1H9FIX3_9RHOB|nr:Hint domain-containing protein [Thalassovita taeanensis]SEQ37891.1 Hemolysin-type calcium-binding repeat-containing protein [Thalassovita taeanensis]